MSLFQDLANSNAQELETKFDQANGMNILYITTVHKNSVTMAIKKVISYVLKI